MRSLSPRLLPRSTWLLCLATLLLIGGWARAEFRNEAGKAGPWMFNLKLGPAISARNDVTSFVIQANAGYIVTPDGAGYVTFSPGIQVGTLAVGVPGFLSNVAVLSVLVPVGFEYDFPVNPVPGLYIYPRIDVGYAAQIVTGNDVSSGTFHRGYVEPAVGAKYVFHRRWQVGVEPLSLPVSFGSANGNTTTSISYRLLVYGGINL